MEVHSIRYALIVFCLVGSAHADERLAGIACRSVHLGFPAEPCRAFAHAVTVKNSAPGTYFMVCGWSTGYFGIQELGNGKKLLIFSVWDSSKTNDPHAVSKEKRVKLVDKDPEVRVGRFGGEGTGGQSFLDFEWKPEQKYRFMVSARQGGDRRAEYTGWFFHPMDNAWKRLVTFSTPSSHDRLTGLYSFVEDFKRDRISTTKTRRAFFQDAWVYRNKSWEPLTKARFTADANPATTIDAGPIDGGFFLATGGVTKNKTTTLRELMVLQTAPHQTPTDLPTPP